ncbi:3918_t:CDS:2, partial [Ambispora leptoticha]
MSTTQKQNSIEKKRIPHPPRQTRKFKKHYREGRVFHFFPEEPCSFADFLGGTEYTLSRDGDTFTRVVKFFRDAITKVEIQEKMEHFSLVVIQDRERARNMFVVTPVRHIERLSECTDEEIFELFHFAVQLIGEETKLSNSHWAGLQFEKMTLNHGNARNLEHLHLK